jgi:hypothetical protein
VKARRPGRRRPAALAPCQAFQRAGGSRKGVNPAREAGPVPRPMPRPRRLRLRGVRLLRRGLRRNRGLPVSRNGLAPAITVNRKPLTRGPARRSRPRTRDCPPRRRKRRRLCRPEWPPAVCGGGRRGRAGSARPYLAPGRNFRHPGGLLPGPAPLPGRAGGYGRSGGRGSGGIGFRRSPAAYAPAPLSGASGPARPPEAARGRDGTFGLPARARRVPAGGWRPARERGGSRSRSPRNSGAFSTKPFPGGGRRTWKGALRLLLRDESCWDLHFTRRRSPDSGAAASSQAAGTLTSPPAHSRTGIPGGRLRAPYAAARGAWHPVRVRRTLPPGRGRGGSQGEERARPLAVKAEPHRSPSNCLSSPALGNRTGTSVLPERRRGLLKRKGRHRRPRSPSAARA